jgi:sec-independent protein translocase protein TatA
MNDVSVVTGIDLVTRPEEVRRAMGSIGAPEILIVILVLVILFGAKKLPELARGSGRAIRIFKAETKGLMDDDDDEDDDVRPAPRQAPPAQLTQDVPPVQQPDASQHAAPVQPPTQRDS